MNKNISFTKGNRLPAMSPSQYHIFTEQEYEKLIKAIHSLLHIEAYSPTGRTSELKNKLKI